MGGWYFFYQNKSSFLVCKFSVWAYISSTCIRARFSDVTAFASALQIKHISKSVLDIRDNKWTFWGKNGLHTNTKALPQIKHGGGSIIVWLYYDWDDKQPWTVLAVYLCHLEIRTCFCINVINMTLLNWDKLGQIQKLGVAHWNKIIKTYYALAFFLLHAIMHMTKTKINNLIEELHLS